MKHTLDNFLASPIGENIMTIAAALTFVLGIFFFA